MPTLTQENHNTFKGLNNPHPGIKKAIVVLAAKKRRAEDAKMDTDDDEDQYLHQNLSISVSRGFSTWETHRNQWKPGNQEIWKPMSKFPETSCNDEWWKPKKPTESYLQKNMTQEYL